jgi:hypothetical protein
MTSASRDFYLELRREAKEALQKQRDAEVALLLAR